MSAVSASVLAEFKNDPRNIVEFARQAKPGAFGRYAPRVFEHAKQGEAIATRLLKEAAVSVDEALDCLVARGTQKICLLGGLRHGRRPACGGTFGKSPLGTTRTRRSCQCGINHGGVHGFRSAKELATFKICRGHVACKIGGSPPPREEDPCRPKPNRSGVRASVRGSGRSGIDLFTALQPQTSNAMHNEAGEVTSSYFGSLRHVRLDAQRHK